MAEARSAVKRESGAYPTAAAFLPDRITMGNLERAAANCRGCPLYRRATQTVFGEGLLKSRLMLVGEMPGNEEDLEGEPFVGPAGRILDRALEEAGIDRRDAYVTNVVKHFKWEERGKRRLHKTPYAKEINACRPWLDNELELIKPDVLVALGAIAARALLGTGFRVSRQRGQFVESDLAPYVTATIHPSAVLRQQTDRERRQELRLLVRDLRKVAQALTGR